MKRGLIIGKGWLGSRLDNYLNHDFEVTTTKRISDANNCISINFDEETNPLDNLNSFNFIVITIPFGKRNSIEELYHRFTNLINFISHYSGQIFLISSIGIYPNYSNIITEATFQPNELNKPYICIENLILKHFPQLTILRLGGIMGDDRYLSKYLNLNRNDIDELVNHIHYQDICKSIESMIKNNIKGEVFNVVAPQHPTKREILEFQINKNLRCSEYEYISGKIISSEKLIKTLKFEFDYPNPIAFL